MGKPEVGFAGWGTGQEFYVNFMKWHVVFRIAIHVLIRYLEDPIHKTSKWPPPHPPTTCPKIKQNPKGPKYKVFSIYVQSNHKYSWYLHIKWDSFYNNIIIKVIHIKFMLVVFTYKEWLLCIIVFLCLFSNCQKMRLLCLNLGLFFLEMYLFLFDSIPPKLIWTIP